VIHREEQYLAPDAFMSRRVVPRVGRLLHGAGPSIRYTVSLSGQLRPVYYFNQTLPSGCSVLCDADLTREHAPHRRRHRQHVRSCGLERTLLHRGHVA
jgi:hypothetical protein